MLLARCGKQISPFFKPTIELVGITRIEYKYYAGSGEVRLQKFFNSALLGDRAVSDLHESMAMVVKLSQQVDRSWIRRQVERSTHLLTSAPSSLLEMSTAPNGIDQSRKT